MAALMLFLHFSRPNVTDCIFALTGQIVCCPSYWLTSDSGALKVSGTVGSSQGREHLDVHTPVCQLHGANHVHLCSSALLLFVAVLVYDSAVRGASCPSPGTQSLRSHSASVPRRLSPVFPKLLTGGARGAGLSLEMPLVLCIILPLQC